MTFLSGKEALLALLRQEGVRCIFGNPGTTELPLMDALAAESGLRYVLGLQEAAVIAMADGYAQASGELAVVNVHVAPGLGNALGMLYDAQKAGTPLLVTAGQHEQGFDFTEPLLWADLPPIARPFVTIQALWTAAHQGAGVVFVVLNNGGYRILKMRVHALKGLAAQHDRYVGMDLTDPPIDFVALAGGLGVRAERVEKTSEVGPSLARALARGGPVLLDVVLDGAFR